MTQSTSRVVRARKTHTCWSCENPIEVGESHVRQACFRGDRVDVFRLHRFCDATQYQILTSFGWDPAYDGDEMQPVRDAVEESGETRESLGEALCCALGLLDTRAGRDALWLAHRGDAA
jgi:hypothetical protein